MVYLMGIRLNHLKARPHGQQGWRSGKGIRLPTMWPGFKSQRRRHTYFVVNSLQCSHEVFLWVLQFSTLLKKPTLPNSHSIWNARTRLSEFRRTPQCFVGKQITIYNFYCAQTSVIIHQTMASTKLAAWRFLRTWKRCTNSCNIIFSQKKSKEEFQRRLIRYVFGRNRTETSVDDGARIYLIKELI